MLPFSLPPETINFQTVQTLSSSRSPSPANEALEQSSSPPTTDDSVITPEEMIKIKSAQSRRKSTSWKGFNFKRQLSKVDMKIKKTLGDSSGGGSSSAAISGNDRKNSVFYYGVEGIPSVLSPVEISPEGSDANSSTPTECEQNKSEYLEELEKDIVKSLDVDVIGVNTNLKDLSLSDDLDSNSNSDIESEPVTPLQSQSPTTGYGVAQSLPKFPTIKQRTMSQPQASYSIKKVDFIEEPFIKSSVPQNEGGSISRPLDLPLQETYDRDRPNPPPRTKKKEKRDQRLLSVPNIKYVKPDVQDLRSKSMKTDQPSFTGNLMRRFSKYLINDW